jgi:radical SAM superfamily enzyme YgiQ (UPF0313 family)
MATINLTISKLKSGDAEAAFQEFIANLHVPNPRQLVLVQPQLVPEDLFDLETARRGGYFIYPPVGLLYIAAVAKQVSPDLEVKVLDLNYEMLRQSQSDHFTYRVWEELLFDAIKDCDAPHVGVTYMFGTTKPTFLAVSKFIRENFPQAPILSGGVQATYDFKEMLESGFCDIVFRNEGELQYKAFLERCLDPNSRSLPRGSAIRSRNGVCELGEPEGDIPLDWDIRPYYSLLDIKNYHLYGSLGPYSRYTGAKKPFATVLSNRGCRARCTFCTVRNFNGFGVRQRPVESVVEEIKFLVREKGIRQIEWLDDDLLWNTGRAVELFKGLATEIPELEWTCGNGFIAVAATEEVMYWMAESGMTAFKIGIESGNDHMLHRIKKPTTKPKLREKRKLFNQYPEVLAGANFIIGFPNETFGEMMDSYNFANELKWDWTSFYVCMPLKGTEMFSAFQELGDDRCEEEGYHKMPTPGRSAPRGEFGYQFQQGGPLIRTGQDIFNLPYDAVVGEGETGKEQLKEIWFTFNLLTNFIHNANFSPGGNPDKLVRWLEALHSGYPHDASMCAGLVRGYKLLGNPDSAAMYRKKFEAILAESAYWRKRVAEFPELLEFAEVTVIPNGQERAKSH